MDRGEAYFYEHYLNASVSEALRSSAAFDLLHFHVGCSVIPLSTLSVAPVLHTIHTGITKDDVWMLRRFPEAAVTVLSKQQVAVAHVPEDRCGSVRVVPYGFDFDSCQCSSNRGEHLAFLGRMAPHKGPDEAIRIARIARRPIWMAGAPVTPDDRVWFEREIEPHVDGTNVIWLGAVDDRRKDELFQRAAALLFPIKWDEPFGLVMLEALARGVPVLAYRRGSVPEVVEEGETGWCADSPEALAALVDQASTLDRGHVREHARRRFSHLRTTDAYLDTYACLLPSSCGGAS